MMMNNFTVSKPQTKAYRMTILNDKGINCIVWLTKEADANCLHNKSKSYRSRPQILYPSMKWHSVICIVNQNSMKYSSKSNNDAIMMMQVSSAFFHSWNLLVCSSRK